MNRRSSLRSLLHALVAAALLLAVGWLSAPLPVRAQIASAATVAALPMPGAHHGDGGTAWIHGGSHSLSPSCLVLCSAQIAPLSAPAAQSPVLPLSVSHFAHAAPLPDGHLLDPVPRPPNRA